jgi:hypothetical protein
MLDVRYINLARRTGRRRWMELQLKLHRLNATRVDALDPEQGRVVLPHSRLQGGELGLNATWVELLREVETTGARDRARWLVLIEDDAVLVPGFRRRITALLDEVPEEPVLVQFAHQTPYTWRRERGLRANMRLCLAYTKRRILRQETRVIADTGDGPFSKQVTWGAHVNAVRVSGIPALLELMEPHDEVTDRAFHLRAETHPGQFLRYQGQLGHQLPFQSDLMAARTARRRLV